MRSGRRQAAVSRAEKSLTAQQQRRFTAPLLFCGYAERVNRPLRFALLTLLLSAFAVAVHSDLPLCPMASSFGIPCPGCGLTRATLAIFHGDVRGALRLHPLVWLLAPLFVGFVGVATFDLVRGPAPSPRKPRVDWTSRKMNVAAVALLVLTLSVWLARFGGYLGGPVPVTSMRAWLARSR